MKADRNKLQLEMARSCMNPQGVAKAAEMPIQTFNKVFRENSVKPATLGRVAKALGVDVTQILKEEA